VSCFKLYFLHTTNEMIQETAMITKNS